MPKQNKKSAPTIEELQTTVDTTQPTKKEKKPSGKPSQYANKVKPYLADIERYMRCGVTEGQLCLYYGVGKTQWVQYKKDNPELTEILCKGKNASRVDLSNKAFTVAMGYDYEETTTVTFKDKQGNVTGSKTTTYKRHAKADGNMIQFLLINRFTDDFARDPQAIELRKKALELAEQGKIPPNGEGY